MASAIGIDLGGTHLRAAVIGAGGSVTGAIRRELPVDAHARRQAAAQVAVELLTAHPGSTSTPSGSLSRGPSSTAC